MKIILSVITLFLVVSTAQATDYFIFADNKNYVEAKYYPPHHEWTPQPGCGVGVDRWSLTGNMEINVVETTEWELFVNANAELHYMVDWADIEGKTGFNGNLRDITLQYAGGVRFDDKFEVRIFHGRELWQPDTREYSRYLYTGIAARYYFKGRGNE